MKNIWLDVDPGHDDATAIMLALNLPTIRLLGVSTTHGNASSEHTALNAARCLFAFGAKPGSVHVYPGADQPLLLPAKHDPQIHGIDGLGGVEGLPAPDDPRVLEFFQLDPDEGSRHVRALEAMPKAIKETWRRGEGNKVMIVSCGPMTNIALFIALYPDLLDAVEEFVFMGGGVGLGNRSAVAEFNILCDPHAAQMVMNSPVKKTMIPINVSHMAIVTKECHRRLLIPGPESGSQEPFPKASTNLRHTLSTLISFFAASYKSTFGFNEGPPLHDALTIAYLSNPELFKVTRYRVDVELTGTHTMGETVVDVWKYIPCDETWGRTGRNCQVAEDLDVKGFFDVLLEAVARCDALSPLNSV